MHIFKVLNFGHLLNNKFQNACKNPWFLRSEIVKNWYKTLKKNKLFLTSICHRFFVDFGLLWGGSWGGLGKLMAVQDGSLKGTIKIFNKIVIFKGFGEGLGSVLGGVGEGFGTFLGGFWEVWGQFGRSGGSLLGFACIFKHFMQFYIFWTSQATPSHVSHFLASGCMLPLLK